MTYATKNGRVMFGGRAVRGADAGSFVAGPGAWGWDERGAYHEGQKVPRVHRETFVAIGERVARDRRALYYPLAGSSELVRAPLMSLARAALEFVTDDRFVFVLSPSAVLVGSRYCLIELPGADRATFVPLGGGYAKDAAQVFWFDDDGRPTRLEDADAATFCVDSEGARDASGSFVRGRRAGPALPIERAGDPLSAARELVASIWAELVPRLFAEFDLLPNDDPCWNGPRVPLKSSAVPPHRLELSADGGLELELAGRTQRGTVAGMELLAGWLFGAAHAEPGGGAVNVRVTHETRHVLAWSDGSPPLWARSLDLAYCLERLGARDEARLIVRTVLREHRHAPPVENADLDPRHCAERLLPAVVASLPEEEPARGTTTQAATKWIVSEGLHTHADPVVRLKVAEELFDIVRATRVETGRLARLSEDLLTLLDDPFPAVVGAAAIAFDELCHDLFSKGEYEQALALATTLDARGVNRDMQCARRWACLSALGRADEADLAWKDAQAASRRPHRAKHPIGPEAESLAAWRAFRELDLARSCMWAADGKHPSPQRREKGVALEATGSREDWIERATEHVEAAMDRMQSLILSEPARSIGPLVADFREEYARITHRYRIEGMPFVAHFQYVSYRQFAEPFEFLNAAVLAAGRYEDLGRRVFELAEPATDIQARLGVAFGVDFTFRGTPVGRILPVRITVTRPTAGGDPVEVEYPATAFLGVREIFVWLFETEDELVAGTWTITITLFSADPPADHPFHGTLQPKDPLATLRQEFRVTVG